MPGRTKTPAWIIWASSIGVPPLLAGIGWFCSTFASMVQDVRDLKSSKTTNRQFWRLHHWETDRINEIRVHAGMQPPLVTWPSLEIPDDEPKK